MKAILHWRKPNCVTAWEWRHIYFPGSIWGFRLYWKIAAVVSLPVMAIIYGLTPEMFWSRAITACLGFAAFSLYMPAHMWAIYECKVDYRLDTRGLLVRRRGLGSNRYLWKHLIHFEVQRYPHVHGMRMVILQVKGHARKIALIFDPGEVDERQLAAWIAGQACLLTQ